MRTISYRRSHRSPPGDTVRLCSYCGVAWYRSQLTRDAAGNLACPDDVRGRDVVTLNMGNLDAYEARRKPGQSGMPQDGTIPSVVTDTPPPFNWNGVNYLPPNPTGDPFPNTVSPALWLDGDQQSYSDAAGTVQSSAPTGIVRRINEASPLTGNWTAPSAAESGLRDSNAVRLDPTPNTTFGQNLVHTGVSTNTNNLTLVVSWRNRGGFGTVQDAILASLAPLCGIVGSYSPWIYYNGGSIWAPSFTVARGSKVTLAVRFTPTGINAKALIDGVAVTPPSLTATVNAAASGDWYLGINANGALGCYSHISQAIIVNRAVTDVELGQLLVFSDAKPLPDAFPLTSPLILVCGDSIAAVNPGAQRNQGWPHTMLFNLRATGPGTGAELCNAAITGNGTALSSYTADAQLFVSRSRTKNVVIETAGTNDLANGNGAASVIANLTAIYAAVRADGGKAVGSTILPRTGSLSVSQGTFDTARATVNAWIVASVSGGFADAIADVASIAGMSTNADAAGSTNFIGDGVHPNAAGHALMAPVYQAAVASLL